MRRDDTGQCQASEQSIRGIARGDHGAGYTAGTNSKDVDPTHSKIVLPQDRIRGHGNLEESPDGFDDGASLQMSAQC